VENYAIQALLQSKAPRRSLAGMQPGNMSGYLDIWLLSEYPDMLICRNMPTDRSYRIYSAGSLGDAIRHYRTEAGLTQAELADATGLQRSYLSELENGKETEQLIRILRVLRRLGVRITLDKAEW